MRKFLVCLILAASVLSLFACGGFETNEGTPQNGIFVAPDNFFLDWDIPSVRDISVTKEGHYSMPVYKFETYEELMHLKEIVARGSIGGESYSRKYNEEFFEKYTLLIGWHQYSGVVISEHVDYIPEQDSEQFPETEAPEASDGEQQEETPEATPNTSSGSVATYEITYDGSLVVNLQGEKSQTDDYGQWVFVAVPKDVMANCDSIVFFVKLPEEE